MRARHGHFWCFTCDEPGEMCRARKHHDVRWVSDQPLRSWASPRKLEPVDPERGRELFAQMFANLPK